ncbi:MAG: hypothetical protein FWC53_03495 [Firmicutes bacterium]|nr:hypothetical protein [Bacillota bacterium]
MVRATEVDGSGILPTQYNLAVEEAIKALGRVATQSPELAMQLSRSTAFLLKQGNRDQRTRAAVSFEKRAAELAQQQNEVADTGRGRTR